MYRIFGRWSSFPGGKGVGRFKYGGRSWRVGCEVLVIDGICGEGGDVRDLGFFWSGEDGEIEDAGDCGVEVWFEVSFEMAGEREEDVEDSGDGNFGRVDVILFVATGRVIGLRCITICEFEV